MSNHERWVVYPLLFLSLGLALRNVVLTQQQQEKGLDTTIIHTKAVDANLVQSKTVHSNVVQCKVLEVSSLSGDRALYLTHEGSDVSIVEGRLEGGRFTPQNRGRIIWQPWQPPRRQDPSPENEEPANPNDAPKESPADPTKKAEPKAEQA